MKNRASKGPTLEPRSGSNITAPPFADGLPQPQDLGLSLLETRRPRLIAGYAPEAVHAAPPPA
ncbi:hypothetical protein [Nocardia carnea]|uniref:hypothetical protein n=1 Tax=Nocardia carnea TaxID=37328 RepID=UPI002456D652|nr:hypothetical protein [Nocardia carnea]